MAKETYPRRGATTAGGEIPDPAREDADLDRVLIGAIAGGEPRAMEVFYDRHAPFVLGVLRSILTDGGGLEDALQDVFWQVWRTAARYDPLRGSAHTWLYQIARSRAMDARRRRPREAPLEVLDLGEPDPGAEAAFAEVEGRAFLAPFRSALSADEEAVVHLVFDRGCTQAEAAAILGVPLGTAKGRIRSALRRLRSILPKDPDSDLRRGDG